MRRIHQSCHNIGDSWNYITQGLEESFKNVNKTRKFKGIKVIMATPTIVSVEWLREQLSEGNPDLCVLDCSWSITGEMEKAYEKKHISTAGFFNILYKTEPTKTNPRPIPKPEVMEEYLQSLGVSTSSHVILYDHCGNCGFFYSSHAWWMLKFYGLTKVSVLDGGFAKWLEAGYETVDSTTKKEPGDFKMSVRSSMMLDHQDMINNLTDKKYTIVDTRPRKKYEGIADDSTSGHYPDAINIPFNLNLLDTQKGVMRSMEEVKQVLSDNNITLSDKVVSMCHCGMSSCILVLLAHCLGVTEVKLYQGGMVDWSSRYPQHVVREG